MFALILNSVFIKFISNSEMMSDKSHLKMEAISLLKTSLIKSECSNFLFCLKAISLAFLRKCKSSVSKIFIALEAFSQTLHPNCSSVVNLSKMTISGFRFLMSSSKLLSFKTIF